MWDAMLKKIMLEIHKCYINLVCWLRISVGKQMDNLLMVGNNLVQKICDAGNNKS